MRLGKTTSWWMVMLAVHGLTGCGAFGGDDSGDDDDDTSIDASPHRVDAGGGADAGAGVPATIHSDALFAKSFGGPDHDDAGAVAVAIDGTVYLAGGFSGTVAFGDTELTSAGDTDVYVVKLSPTGATVWARRYGGTGPDVARRIALDGGAVYVVGDFSLTGDFDGTELVSAGDTDVFALRLDEEGALAWARRYGGPGADLTHGATADGELYVVGDFSLTADFEGTALASAGGTDGFAARIGTDGTLRWATRLGGGGADRCRGIATDATDVYVVGDFSLTSDFGGGPLTSAGGLDGFAVRLAAAGGAYGGAQVRFGGPGDDGAAATALRSSGGGAVYVVGDFSLTADFPSPIGSQTAGGPSDLFALQLTTALGGGWLHALGGGGAEHGADLAVDGAGGVFVVGDFSLAFSPFILEGAGGSDVLVARFASDGTLQWARSAGGAGADVGAGVAYSPSEGALVFAGPFEQTLRLEGVELDSAGMSDAFVIKIKDGGALRWARDVGGDGAATLSAVAAGADGTVAVVGEFDGSLEIGGGGRLTGAGGRDGFVAVYDGDGAYRWAATVGGPSNDFLRHVGIGSNGEIVVAGQFAGTLQLGDDTLTGGATGTQEAFFVAVYSPDGEYLNSFAVRATAGDFGASMVVFDMAVSDRIAVAGGFNGTADFGDGEVDGASFTNGFLLVRSLDGTHQWSRPFVTSDGSDCGIAAVAFQGTTVLVAGSSGGDLDLGGASVGFQPFLVAYSNPDGDYAWHRAWTADPSTGVIDMAVEPGGQIAIAGLVRGSVDFGSGAINGGANGGGFVASLDFAGFGRWAYAMPSSSTSLASEVAVDSVGNVAAGGYFDTSFSILGVPYLSAGSADGFIVSVSRDGVLQRVRTIGGAGLDELVGLAIDGSDRAVAAGPYMGETDVGAGEVLPGNGMFLLQLRP